MKVTELKKCLRESGFKVSGIKAELVERLQAANLPSGKSKRESAESPEDDCDQQPARRQKNEQIVRLRFWKRPDSKRIVDALKSACRGITHLEGTLTVDEQRQFFPYMFWPPPPGWCLVQFNIPAKKRVARGNNDMMPLPYGFGPHSDDYMWRQGVVGIIQPEQK